MLVIMLLSAIGSVVAQRTADIGVQLGVANYWGDIQKQDNWKSITPVVGLLGRWNFNNRLAVRGQLLTGNLKSVDGIYRNTLIGQSGNRSDYFPADPNYSFNFNRSFQTAEGLMEFNFYNYKLGSMKKETFTPFVALGLGVFYSTAPRSGSFILDPSTSIKSNLAPSMPLYAPYTTQNSNANAKRTNGYDVATVSIPFGAGLKFNITKRLGGMIEGIIRKTFSDNIDNLNDPLRFQNPGFLQRGYSGAVKGLNHNDYYATVDFSLFWQVWNDKGNCVIREKTLH